MAKICQETSKVRFCPDFQITGATVIKASIKCECINTYISYRLHITLSPIFSFRGTAQFPSLRQLRVQKSRLTCIIHDNKLRGCGTRCTIELPKSGLISPRITTDHPDAQFVIIDATSKQMCKNV